MANCPNCQVPLQTVRQRDGIYFHCGQCDGRAATIQQIRRTTGDRFASRLVRLVNTATELSTRLCPFCQSPMKLAQVPQPPLALDSCRTCTMIWFDAGKFEQLPEGVLETPEDALARALEAEAQWKIDQQRDRNSLSNEPPDKAWKWIPAFLGLPVKFESAEMTQLPWATWSLSAVIAIISIIAFSHLEAAVETFGLIPAEAWRYGGATLLTSFFIHGGIFHLFGNLYFFLLFGGEVENCIGRWRFFLLLLLSTITGDFLHMLFNAHSEAPLIGASGGISGVLVFYAVQFPRAKLSFLFRLWFRFVWVHIPSWVAFAVWLLFQVLGAYWQVSGSSHVASLAHLGGVLTGFIFWLVWRKQKTEESTQDRS